MIPTANNRAIGGTSAVPAKTEATTTMIPPNHPAIPNTPSQIVKSKWSQVLDELPDEGLAIATRTYTNRLHQLRLQREKHRGVLDRHSKPDASLPYSCRIPFELGASLAIRETPAYLALKGGVEATIAATQQVLHDAIVQLQGLELEAKEGEIRAAFCQGLCQIAVALINHHRDHHHDVFVVAETMQTMRLADRLVELLMERHRPLLEYSFLTTQEDPTNQYYQVVGRQVPTHCRKQNRDSPSSPYNSHHSKILEGILDEYRNIIEPCFHASWKDYLEARTKWNQQQHQDHEQLHSTKINNNHKMPSAQDLKEMVHMAVTEETKALKDTIRDLEERLQRGSIHDTAAASPPANVIQVAETNQGGEGAKGKGKRNQKNNNKKNGAPNDADANPKKDDEDAKTVDLTTVASDQDATPQPADATEGAKKGKNQSRKKRGKGKNNTINADTPPETVSAETTANQDGTPVPENGTANQNAANVKEEGNAPSAVKADPEAAEVGTENGGATPTKNGTPKKNRNRRRNKKGKGANATNDASSSNGNATNNNGTNKDNTAELFGSYHSAGGTNWH